MQQTAPVLDVTTTVSTSVRSVYSVVNASRTTHSWSFNTSLKQFVTHSNSISSLTIGQTYTTAETFVTTTATGTLADRGGAETIYLAGTQTVNSTVNNAIYELTAHEVLWAKVAPTWQPSGITWQPATSFATSGTQFTQTQPEQRKVVSVLDSSESILSEVVSQNKTTLTFATSDTTASKDTLTFAVLGSTFPLQTQTTTARTATRTTSMSFLGVPSINATLTAKVWRTVTQWFRSYETFQGMDETRTISSTRSKWTSATSKAADQYETTMSSSTIIGATTSGTTFDAGCTTFADLPLMERTSVATTPIQGGVLETTNVAVLQNVYGQRGINIGNNVSANVTGFPRVSLQDYEATQSFWAPAYRTNANVVSAAPGIYSVDVTTNTEESGLLSVSANSWTLSVTGSATTSSTSSVVGLQSQAATTAVKLWQGGAQNFSRRVQMGGKLANGETAYGFTREGVYRVSQSNNTNTTHYPVADCQSWSTTKDVSVYEALTYFVPNTDATAPACGNQLAVWAVARNQPMTSVALF